MKFEDMHPRDQIVMCMNRIYSFDMTTTSGGNLSVLDSDNNMWISPSGVDKGTLRPEDIMCVKADGKIEGLHKPSVEYPFHRAIYNIRSDVKAIVHAHPPALVAFSIARKIPDTTILPNTMAVCGSVGYAAYAVPGSEELGKKIAEKFGEGFNSILLENHGTVTCGASMMEAYQRFETLDFCARMEMQANIIAKPSGLTADKIEFSNQADQLHEFKPGVKSSRERELRKQLCDFVRRSYRQQLFTSSEGTYAVRLENDSFLVTPSGKDRLWIDEDDIVLVKEGKRETGKTPSRAARFIRNIFKAQPHINSVVLAHPPAIMAFAVSGIKFDSCTIPESYIVLRDIPLIKFGEQYAKIKETAELFSKRTPVAIIENECIITTGSSILQAFDRLEVLEYSAKAVIAAKAIGNVLPINGAQTEELIKAFKLD